MTTKLHANLLTSILVIVSCLTISATAFAGSIQKVRIDFTMPNGYVRHLLLGFTSDNIASDGYDYGYDALNKDDFPDDLNWIIENDRYVTQTVGAFDNTKKYPLGLFLQNGGDIKIDLDTTYGFDSPINVYIFDALHNTYTHLNNSSYTESFVKGEYLDRFYLAFKNDNNTNATARALSTEEAVSYKTKIQYLRSSKELYINTGNGSKINEITITNSSGQRLLCRKNINSDYIKTSINQIANQLVFISVVTDTGYSSKKIIFN